jgi:tetratricopeptide (TPR) repeat protein
MLRNKLVVVCAYGGWQDTFTETLVELIRDDTAYPEILWTFYSAKPEADARLERLAPGIDRGNISLYAGIDCHELFPRLYESWVSIVAPHPTHLTDDGPMVRVPAGIAEQIRQKPARTTVLEGDDEDRPPLIDICVGRDDEFRSIQESSARVVFVTGLGGQGKSTLVAKYYLACQDPPAKYSYLVWRDCKEESERFELQLASVIETISNGQISGTDLARQDAETIIALLLKHTQGLSILFVFDNADHYVDIEKRRMLGSADTFVNALLKESSESRVIFTCRPTVEYDVDLALSIPLGGIDLFSARRLFEERKAVVGNSEIETAHRLTGGHAFWLDLLAVQVTKGNLGREFALLLDDIGEGGGPLPEPTLHSIWSTLKPREQAVLRSMAESVRPASEALIADYVSGELTFHKASKAIRALRSLNLVVVKTKVKGPDLFELHPLVRAFIRRRFPMRERASYIGGIIKVYKRLIGQHRGELEKRPRLSVLQYWTQSAELAIALGSFDEAFDTLNEVDSAFAHSGYPRELARVSRLLFSSLDWVVEHSKYKHFEVLFKSFVRTLAHLGEIGAVDELLDKYERSVPDRGVRYIRYCELRSYAFWFRSDFKAALVWGRAGQKLVDQSNVDSTISWPIRHTLALAERDAGLPEVALPIFLDGRQLAEVIDSKELSDDRGEHHYGNIGRCLQFMEQDDSALICYQKSALLIERAVRGETLLNKAYARTWIGEVLMGRDRLDLAYAFLRSAQRLWDQVAPPKAPAVNLLVKEAERRAGRAFRMRVPEIEKTCLDWILGQTRNIS